MKQLEEKRFAAYNGQDWVEYKMIVQQQAVSFNKKRDQNYGFVAKHLTLRLTWD
jgi:hypothetical protein